MGNYLYTHYFIFNSSGTWAGSSNGSEGWWTGQGAMSISITYLVASSLGELATVKPLALNCLTFE